MEKLFIPIIISVIACALAHFAWTADDILYEEIELLPFPIGSIPGGEEPDGVRVEGAQLLNFKTHDHYEGFGGQILMIRSEGELADFYKWFGEREETSKFLKGVDFSKTAVAYTAVTLTSGSIGCDFRGVYVSDGNIIFDYSLIYPEIGTCDMAAMWLFAKIPVSALEAAPAEKSGDAGTVALVPFPRKVSIGSETIDNLTEKLVYEEKNARSWSGENYRPGSKAVFLSTDIIKRWYDPGMTCENGVYRFKDGNLDVTITKDTIKAENELFGEVWRTDGINCIVREKDMLVEVGYLIGLLSCGYTSEERPDSNDDFMVKSDITLLPDSIGDVNVGELKTEGYRYYTMGTTSKKPDGKIVAVNLRGNYIYRTSGSKYYLEANGKYYVIYGQLTGCLEAE